MTGDIHLFYVGEELTSAVSIELSPSKAWSQAIRGGSPPPAAGRGEGEWHIGPGIRYYQLQELSEAGLSCRTGSGLLTCHCSLHELRSAANSTSTHSSFKDPAGATAAP